MIEQDRSFLYTTVVDHVLCHIVAQNVYYTVSVCYSISIVVALLSVFQCNGKVIFIILNVYEH